MCGLWPKTQFISPGPVTGKQETATVMLLLTLRWSLLWSSKSFTKMVLLDLPLIWDGNQNLCWLLCSEPPEKWCRDKELRKGQTITGTGAGSRNKEEFSQLALPPVLQRRWYVARTGWFLIKLRKTACKGQRISKQVLLFNMFIP